MKEKMKSQIKTSLSKNKPAYNEKDLGLNPFLQSLNIKVRHNTNLQRVTPINEIKLEDNIVTIGKTITNESVYIVELDEKATLYTRAGFRLHIVGMSDKAKSLFLWLTYELDYGKDYVWINVSRYLLETDTSLNTYKAAVIELVKNAVINPIVDMDNMFWINPVFFFKGNRAKAFQNNLELVK
jgi:hypothetical protein